MNAVARQVLRKPLHEAIESLCASKVDAENVGLPSLARLKELVEASETVDPAIVAQIDETTAAVGV